MKSTAVRIYQVDLPIRDAPYAWSTFAVDGPSPRVVRASTAASCGPRMLRASA